MTADEKLYYENRAPEYDDWYRGAGLYAARDRPGWQDELAQLCSVIANLKFNTVLDVACGTGFLTQHLACPTIGLDQSLSMLRVARDRSSHAQFVLGDALQLPFRDRSFDCVMAGHFYGHLHQPERRAFLTEARRIAPGLLIVDSARRPGVPSEEVQQRLLKDGSEHTVYKRYFAPDQLLAELSGGSLLHAGRWFVAVLA